MAVLAMWRAAHALLSHWLLQVEFYFSDANLPTDKHLLKQISKDPEGYGEAQGAAAAAAAESLPAQLLAAVVLGVIPRTMRVSCTAA